MSLSFTPPPCPHHVLKKVPRNVVTAEDAPPAVLRFVTASSSSNSSSNASTSPLAFRSVRQRSNSAPSTARASSYYESPSITNPEQTPPVLAPTEASASDVVLPGVGAVARANKRLASISSMGERRNPPPPGHDLELGRLDEHIPPPPVAVDAAFSASDVDSSEPAVVAVAAFSHLPPVDPVVTAPILPAVVAVAAFPLLSSVDPVAAAPVLSESSPLSSTVPLLPPVDPDVAAAVISDSSPLSSTVPLLPSVDSVPAHVLPDSRRHVAPRPSALVHSLVPDGFVEMVDHFGGYQGLYDVVRAGIVSFQLDRGALDGDSVSVQEEGGLALDVLESLVEADMSVALAADIAIESRRVREVEPSGIALADDFYWPLGSPLRSTSPVEELRGGPSAPVGPFVGSFVDGGLGGSNVAVDGASVTVGKAGGTGTAVVSGSGTVAGGGGGGSGAVEASRVDKGKGREVVDNEPSPPPHPLRHQGLRQLPVQSVRNVAAPTSSSPLFIYTCPPSPVRPSPPSPSVLPTALHTPNPLPLTLNPSASANFDASDLAAQSDFAIMRNRFHILADTPRPPNWIRTHDRPDVPYTDFNNLPINFRLPSSLPPSPIRDLPPI
ncbi:hypothetical protein P7C70_g9030, partial [Phenoliferia sp. Uapishka_3]